MLGLVFIRAAGPLAEFAWSYITVSRALHAASQNDVSGHANSDRRSSIASPSPSPPPSQTPPNGTAVNVDADDAAAYKHWLESEEKSRQGKRRVSSHLPMIIVLGLCFSASYALTQRYD